MNAEPLTITIPNHRPVSKNVGRRQHWAKRRDTKRDVYTQVRLNMPEQVMDGPAPFFTEPVVIRSVSYQTGRLQDNDNFDVKDYVDALCHFGVIQDDSKEFVERTPARVERSPDKTNYITITIEPVITQATKETA